MSGLSALNDEMLKNSKRHDSNFCRQQWLKCIYLNDISSWFNNIDGYRYFMQNVASQCKTIVENSSGRLLVIKFNK